MWLQTFLPRLPNLIAKAHCYHITFILKTDSTPVGNIGHLAYLGNTAARGMLPVLPVYVMSECLPGLHICPYSSICNCLGIFYVHSQTHTVQESDRTFGPASLLIRWWVTYEPASSLGCQLCETTSHPISQPGCCSHYAVQQIYELWWTNISNKIGTLKLCWQYHRDFVCHTLLWYTSIPSLGQKSWIIQYVWECWALKPHHFDLGDSNPTFYMKICQYMNQPSLVVKSSIL